MPEAWDEFTRAELAPALGESRYAVDTLLDLAHDLTVKLPGTMAAFREGVISRYKAQVISHATQLLDPAEARAAEAMVLDRAGRLTPGALRSAIGRAVMKVAPDKARKRREKAAKSAEVQWWADSSGTAALMGRELPPAEVLAAGQRIDSWAGQLKAAGLEGSAGGPGAPGPHGPLVCEGALARRGPAPGRRPEPGRLRRDDQPDPPAGHASGPGRPAGRDSRHRADRSLAGSRPGRRGRAESEDEVVRDCHRQARTRDRARM